MTWRFLFTSLGINWCSGCDALYDHDKGYMAGGTYHWRDRRCTRPAIYRVLRAIAYERNPPFWDMPRWRRVYLVNHEVLTLTGVLGTRLPRSVFEIDRAQLRFALSEFSNEDRRRMTPSEQDDFRRAMRWAARS